MLQKALRIHIRITKGLLRLAARGLIGGKQLALAADNTHTAAAAAGYGLEDQGIADSHSLLRKLLFPFHNAVASGNRRQSRRFHLAPRAVLLSHHFDDFGGRADEGNLRPPPHLGKIGVLRKKTIPRPNSVHLRHSPSPTPLR